MKFWSIQTLSLDNVDNSNMWNASKKCSEAVEEKLLYLKMGRNGETFINAFLIIMTKESLHPKRSFKYQ